ncbi:ArnT family glycosyltransferase [Nocardia altamirensis]|uniref:ArnT family glycosyltransferase n=1 Tax=Nocardia altamirensis TaxID=472158 RepID=UPI0008403334|nr:glycosyltransferase family 39 protein [Nocardia altamirensis]
MTTAARPPDTEWPSRPVSRAPRWARPSLAALLIGTAVLYLWGLGASGWANDFYAAAVQAGTQSWKALLFGSLDAGNAITVDKPPAAIWVMALSGRLFGFGPWSLLVPQALMGVGSVALLYSAVKRWSGHGAGLLAGAILALTPVAALMFRFDNPDALLVLLLVAAAYCMVRATASGSTGWLVLAGTAVGFAFLTKLLQAFLVLPAFGLVFLVAAPGGIWKRIGKLLIACLAMVISGGWFVALVSLWPAASRPYIGGSTNNSLWELALGYNGLGRIVGGEGNGGGPGGGSANAAFGGSTGITRLFGDSMGTEISWLLPAALIGLVAGLWFSRPGHHARWPGIARAGLLLWGVWLVTTGLVFSYMSGTIHPYYTVALVPAIAAVVAISVYELWRGKEYLAARVVLGAMVVATGIWNYILLDRTHDWLPWLRWVLLIGALAVAAVLIAGGHQLRKFTVVLVTAGLLFGLGGTTAYAIDTAAQPHSGSIPTSGPSTVGASAGMPGGPGDNTSTNTVLETLLQDTTSRWAAATVGSHGAVGLELDTGKSVMAIGGFSGSDNSPTLAQFQQYVAGGDIRYFIRSDGPGRDGRTGDGPERGPDGGADNSGGTKSVGQQITTWVQTHFASTTVGGTTVYDLSSPLSL